MKTNRSMLVLMAVSSTLLAGCCGVHPTAHWEYKITLTPQTPEEKAAMRGATLQEQENYLNSLGSDGWVLVSEDQGLLYLKRPKK